MTISLLVPLHLFFCIGLVRLGDRVYFVVKKTVVNNYVNTRPTGPSSHLPPELPLKLALLTLPLGARALGDTLAMVKGAVRVQCVVRSVIGRPLLAMGAAQALLVASDMPQWKSPLLSPPLLNEGETTDLKMV